MTTISAPVELPLHRRPAVRWAAGLLAVVVALNLVVAVLGAFLTQPSGPASSSYATSSAGLAAYAELLSRLGHPVMQSRRPPDAGALTPDVTAVLLDPTTGVGPSDVAALRRFVAGGGRLIAGGADTGALASALAGTPVAWRPGGPKAVRVSVVPGVRRVQTTGRGRWDCRRAGRSLAGAPGASLVCAVQRGRVLLLADSSPLTNALLDRADNAALGLALAGPRGRPVVFVENVHGFTTATGLAALPARAWWALGLLALAGLVFLLARWRRLGPAVESDAIAAPARREHVDALTAALEQAGDRGPAAALRVRDAARVIVIRRAGLRRHPAESQIEDAALALGLSEHDAALLIGETARGEDLVELGRLLAHLRSEAT